MELWRPCLASSSTLAVQRAGRGTNIFEPELRDDAALFERPVVAELGQRAVEPRVVACAGDPKSSVAARADIAKPWTAATAQVHRPLSIEAVEPLLRRSN